MFKQAYILDVTDTSGNIREAIDDYAANMDTSNGCYYCFYKDDMLEWIEDPENHTESVIAGWKELHNLCTEQNIDKFYVHYWW